MTLNVYVGPYLVVHSMPDEKIVEIMDNHLDVVFDGRGESGNEDENRYLLPNKKLAGVFRRMSFDKYGDDEKPMTINDGAIELEKDAFVTLVSCIIDEINIAGGFYQVLWGVVTGYF